MLDETCEMNIAPLIQSKNSTIDLVKELPEITDEICLIAKDLTEMYDGTYKYMWVRSTARLPNKINLNFFYK